MRGCDRGRSGSVRNQVAGTDTDPQNAIGMKGWDVRNSEGRRDGEPASGMR